MTPQPRRHRTGALVVALVVLAGLSVGAAASPLGGGVVAAQATPTPTTPTTPGGTPTDGASVTFENQSLVIENNTVAVDAATLPEGGFVAIHRMNESVQGTVDDAPEEVNQSTLGEAIGSTAYLDPGSHQGMTVTFEVPVTNDQTLVAVVYRDTDGSGEFDVEADEPYVDAGGIVADTAFVDVESDETPTTPTPAGTATPDGTPAPDGTATPDGTVTPAGTPSPGPTSPSTPSM